LNRSKPYSLTRSHWRSPSARRFSRLSTRNGSLAFRAQMRHPPDCSPGLRPRIAHSKTQLRDARMPPYVAASQVLTSIVNKHSTQAMCTLQKGRSEHGHTRAVPFLSAKPRQFGGHQPANLLHHWAKRCEIGAPRPRVIRVAGPAKRLKKARISHWARSKASST